MDIKEIANGLVALLREGKFQEAQEKYLADDAVSIEPESQPMHEARGRKAIEEKGKMFQSMVEENHGGYVSEPIIAGSYFSVAFGMDVTMKERGRAMMEEICVYKVENGKIIREEFFF